MNPQRALACLLLACLALMPSGGVRAATVAYAWQPANLALVYPAGWDEPAPLVVDDRPTLYLAQVQADEPDFRPPAAQAITLTIYPDAPADADLAALLSEALARQGTPTSLPPVESVFARSRGYQAAGGDGTLSGFGRAFRLEDGRALVAAGRAAVEQADAFALTFATVLDSIVVGADNPPITPGLGVLWRLDSATSGFTDLRAVTSSADNVVYAVDAALGVVRLNGDTGETLGIMSAAAYPDAVDAAVDTTGSLYLADPGCDCLRVIAASGVELDPLGAFGPGAPASVAVGADAAVYAPDQDETGVAIRVFRDGQSVRTIELGEKVQGQPLLAADPAGRIIALTPDGQVILLTDSGYDVLFTLAMPFASVSGLAIDRDNNLVLTTGDQGLVIIDSAGAIVEQIGQIVPNRPQPGELVAPTGVAVAASGAILVADGDGTVAALTAFSRSALPERVGAQTLTTGQAVHGRPSATLEQQLWTYTGTAGEQLTLAAVDSTGADQLDVALRLLAPDGSEIAYNDDRQDPFFSVTRDAQLTGIPLPASGAYTVIVEHVGGSGMYSLGVNTNRALTVDSENVTRVEGEIWAVFPAERWQFSGSAGQQFTITMRAESGTLDPALRLLTLDGEVLYSNDDASDPELGVNAQLVQVQLPADGDYVLEATRYNGAGRYSLLIVPTA